MRIAIAGAGIAGLTSAIALSQRGFQVDLFERASGLEEIGAGIQLSPNATAVLEKLGVMAELAGKLSEPEALSIRDGRTGALLARMPLGEVARARYGSPYVTLHRADLQAALLASARRKPQISIRFDAEVREIKPAGDEVAFAAANEDCHADVLLAGDGIHSRIRTEYFGHPGPASFGRSAWRAIVPAQGISAPMVANEIGLWLGAGGHLVHYPVNAGSNLNIVVIAGEGRGSTPPVTPFGAARRMIALAQTWHPSPLLGVEASLPRARGRIALLGDAAHAMAPSAAQGGAFAIEDAWAISQVLAASRKEPEHALGLYAANRTQRAARVARLALKNLNAYELRGVPALLRNSILRASPAMLLLSRFDWLYSYYPK
jgi:salicylate hydroxylase